MKTKGNTCTGQELLLSTVHEKDTATVIEWIRITGLPTAIANVYDKIWSVRFQNIVESVLVDRCIKEGYVKTEDITYILRYPRASRTSSEPLPRVDAGVEVMWTHLRVHEHFKDTSSHRHWLIQSFHRLVIEAKIFGELASEVVEDLRVRCELHDLSKFRLEQAVGYTLRWVHGLQSPLWTYACNLHLLEEDHHPQHYFRRTHIDEGKPVCEHQGDTHFDDERMSETSLYESILDMVACRWERRLGGDTDVPIRLLADITEEKNALRRYCPYDLAFVREIYKKIQNFDDFNSG